MHLRWMHRMHSRVQRRRKRACARAVEGCSVLVHGFRCSENFPSNLKDKGRRYRGYLARCACHRPIWETFLIFRLPARHVDPGPSKLSTPDRRGDLGVAVIIGQVDRISPETHDTICRCDQRNCGDVLETSSEEEASVRGSLGGGFIPLGNYIVYTAA